MLSDEDINDEDINDEDINEEDIIDGDADVSLDEIVEKCVEEEKQQIIEENLKNIQFTKSKLRFAQELYYGGKGRSPLTRSNNSTTEIARPPVHARLGRRIRLRTVPVNVNTDTILPKNRRILRLNKNNINTRGNSGKYMRLISRGGQAQLRLERIRRQQLEALQNPQLIQPLSKFRLRRRRLNALPFQTGPTNYTVQIPNNVFMNDRNESIMHSIHSELDEDIQSEILRIQLIHAHPHERIQSLPQLSMSTAFTLNDRFSALP